MQPILDNAGKLSYNLIDKGNLTNFLLSGAAITPILSIPGQVLGLALGKTVWCRKIRWHSFLQEIHYGQKVFTNLYNGRALHPIMS